MTTPEFETDYKFGKCIKRYQYLPQERDLWWTLLWKFYPTYLFNKWCEKGSKLWLFWCKLRFLVATAKEIKVK